MILNKKAYLVNKITSGDMIGFVGKFTCILRFDYLFVYWNLLRALFCPYFLRSFARGSLVRKPLALRIFLKFSSIKTNDRAIPSLMAPAWPLIPPPTTFTLTSYLS